MATDDFSGFSRDSFAFFRELSANNQRRWFEENKARYNETVIAPAQAFIAAMGARLSRKMPDLCFDTRSNGSGSIFRIHRDTRFAKDKSPYKTNLGVLFWYEGEGSKKENPGYYFHLNADGALMYAGIHCLPKDKLERFRESVADAKKGRQLERTLAKLRKSGFETGGAHYKRVPAGYPADHPNAALLKYNALWARSEKIPRKVVQSRDLLNYCQKFCTSTVPLNRWLLDHA